MYKKVQTLPWGTIRFSRTVVPPLSLVSMVLILKILSFHPIELKLCRKLYDKSKNPNSGVFSGGEFSPPISNHPPPSQM